MKEDEVVRACSTYGSEEKYRVIFRKIEGKQVVWNSKE
jgi:hypothetical protein